MGPSRNCSRIKQGAALPNGLPPIAKQRTRNYTLAPGRVGYTRAIPKKRYHTDDAVGSRSQITPLTKMYIYIYIRIVVLSVDKVLSTEKSNFRKESRKFEFLAWNIVTIEWVSSEKRWGKRMYVNGWRYRIIAWERERDSHLLAISFLLYCRNPCSSESIYAGLDSHQGRCLHFSGQRLSLYRRYNHEFRRWIFNTDPHLHPFPSLIV